MSGMHSVQGSRLKAQGLALGSRLEARGDSSPLEPIASSLERSHLQPGASSLEQTRGQSTMEYAVFVAVVAAALMGMQVYVRRAIQANLKTLEEQVNAEAVPTPAGQPRDTGR